MRVSTSLIRTQPSYKHTVTWQSKPPKRKGKEKKQRAAEPLIDHTEVVYAHRLTEVLADVIRRKKEQARAAELKLSVSSDVNDGIRSCKAMHEMWDRTRAYLDRHHNDSTPGTRNL